MEFRWAVSLLVSACGATSTPQPGSAIPPRVPLDPQQLELGSTDWRMPGTVDFIDIARDDRAIVVAAQEGAVAVFTPGGERRSLFEGLTPEASGFGRLDARSIALVGTAPVVVDLQTGAKRALALPPHTAMLAMTDDRTRAVVGDRNGALAVVGLANGTRTELARSRGFHAPRIAGDWVIAGRMDHAVAIWDLATGKRTHVFGQGNSELFALTPDHRHVVTGGFTGRPNWEVEIYRIADGVRTATIGFSCNPDVAAVSPDSTLLALACDEEVRVVRVPNGEPVALLDGTRSYVRTVAWSPSGTLLAVGGNDSVLHLWDTRHWDPLTRVEGSRGAIRQLDADEHRLVVHSWGDHSAWLWNADTGKPIGDLGAEAEAQAVGLGRDVVVIAASLTDRPARPTVIERWSRDGVRLGSVQLPSTAATLPQLVRQVGALPDGGIWLTSGGAIETLDADLRSTWHSPAGLGDGEAAGSFDGHRVVVQSGDHLTIVDAVEHRVLADTTPATCSGATPAITADGAHIALIDTEGIRILDGATGAVVATLAAPSESSADRAVAWGPHDEVVGLAGARLIAWRLGAPSFTATPAPGASSLAVAGNLVYLGRIDGTVERHTLAILEHEGKALPAAAITAGCERGDGTMSGIGHLGGDGEARGPLDNAGDYEDP